MLEIQLIMNSSVEEILGFKTCCGLKAFDRNLEILVRNIGSKPASVRGRFDLRGGYGTYRMDAVMPSGGVLVEPGDVKALYCYMDETLWEKSTQVILYDWNETAYHVDITHER